MDDSIIYWIVDDTNLLSYCSLYDRNYNELRVKRGNQCVKKWVRIIKRWWSIKYLSYLFREYLDIMLIKIEYYLWKSYVIHVGKILKLGLYSKINVLEKMNDSATCSRKTHFSFEVCSGLSLKFMTSELIRWNTFGLRFPDVQRRESWVLCTGDIQ